MSITDKDREEELKREAIGGRRMITTVLIAVFLVVICVIWIAIFRLTQSNIDKEVNSMQAADGVESSELIEEKISTVRVKVDDTTYALKEFVDLDEIPTTVTAIVYYEDGNIVEKPSYVSYDDVEDVEYIDNVYGRIIVPNSLHK